MALVQRCARRREPDVRQSPSPFRQHAIHYLSHGDQVELGDHKRSTMIGDAPLHGRRLRGPQSGDEHRRQRPREVRDPRHHGARIGVGQWKSYRA
ncbi:MAG TPA: hypothetical protein VET27_15465 [Mycobacterium sp.]|nr:hypothetical protein [Mycobacterium sp.]